MRSRKFFFAFFAVLFTASLSLASIIIWQKGKWPGPWPKQLEPYRQQTVVVDAGNDIRETIFELSFDNREKFEQAWPEILKLKSKGSPLILEKSPSKYDLSGTVLKSGVRILWPSTEPVKMNDGSILRTSPVEFSSITSHSGELPEYVVEKDGKWIPYDEQNLSDVRHRARADIILITDANIVDLNRIPLPPDTFIIDRRFDNQ
ncbi:MAG: hypothetical protein JW715_02480 [Sedimentisphaerales bacterium]|nr:hypothetical protein [Sedimentisphaerales bacterium]